MSDIDLGKVIDQVVEIRKKQISKIEPVVLDFPYLVYEQHPDKEFWKSVRANRPINVDEILFIDTKAQKIYRLTKEGELELNENN